MFSNPIFIREALTSPRQLRHYLIRSGYVAAVFILIFTAGQTILGTQQIQTVTIGEFARLGNLNFPDNRISTIIARTFFYAFVFSRKYCAGKRSRDTHPVIND